MKSYRARKPSVTPLNPNLYPNPNLRPKEIKIG